MRIIFLFFLIALLGCKPEAQQKVESKWFDIPVLIDELVINMDAEKHKTSKTFVLNNATETKQYELADSSFWARELADLREIDLNVPQLRDIIALKFAIDDPKSNLLIDQYGIIGKTEMSLKKLSIYYLEQPQEIRQISAELDSDNIMASSVTKINLWVNRYNGKLLIDSLQITGNDKMVMQQARVYHSITKTIW